jgi:hypothetical protein
MDLKRMVHRARRDSTPEHAIAQAAITFCGFIIVSQFSAVLAFVLLVGFIFLKNG